jgi:hypothetical protein
MPLMWPRLRRQDLVRAAYEVEGVEPVVRRDGEPCPLCEAAPDQWCKQDCIAVDLMDYR